jgi:hypothetical protein
MLYGPRESQVKQLSGSQARRRAPLYEGDGAGEASGVVLLRPQA